MLEAELARTKGTAEMYMRRCNMLEAQLQQERGSRGPSSDPHSDRTVAEADVVRPARGISLSAAALMLPALPSHSGAAAAPSCVEESPDEFDFEAALAAASAPPAARPRPPSPSPEMAATEPNMAAVAHQQHAAAGANEHQRVVRAPIRLPPGVALDAALP